MFFNLYVRIKYYVTRLTERSCSKKEGKEGGGRKLKESEEWVAV